MKVATEKDFILQKCNSSPQTFFSVAALFVEVSTLAANFTMFDVRLYGSWCLTAKNNAIDFM